MSNDSRDNSIEYLREQARLALERGDKQGCAILTFAHELLAAQSRHAAEREALASEIGQVLEGCIARASNLYMQEEFREAKARILALLSDSGSQG